MVTDTEIAWTRNTRARPQDVYRFGDQLSCARAADARAAMGGCPRYRATPLKLLRGLAEQAGVGVVYYKDEASRFGLGSFKPLGGAYAVTELARAHASAAAGRPVALAELVDRRGERLLGGFTVATATDGNHGASVAAGARMVGCACVVFIHEAVSPGRAAAIAEFGARVVRVAGTYDEAVRAAARQASALGWQVVSDTSWKDYEAVPLMVMQGYGVMVLEVLEQLAGQPHPTHVFLQGGVGGLAAAVLAHLWEALDVAPRVVVVEPDKAACLFRSARAGRLTRAPGDLDTLMAGLACGEPSPAAWRILDAGAEWFMTIRDTHAVEAMRRLAEGNAHDAPVIAGESGAAGVAGFLAAARHPALRAELKLDAAAHVLLIGSEGATDPRIFEALTGRAATLGPAGAAP